MAITDITSVNDALKVFYLPGLRYQLATATPFLAVMEKDSESVVGSEIHMALRYGRHGGVGNRADDGQMPTPQGRQTKQAVWKTKNVFAYINISDKVVKASQTREGAFEDLMQAELDDALSDAKDMVSRECFGDGNGNLGVIQTAAWAANVLTLTLDNAQYVFQGQFVDVIHAGAPLANGSQLQVLSVNVATLTVTLSATVDIHAAITTGTDTLCLYGNYGLELTGLQAVVGSTTNTLYGIDRTQPQYSWILPTQNALNAEISENAIQKQVHTVKAQAGADTDFYLAALGVSRAYGDLLLASRQLVNPTVTLEGGYETVTFRGKPFVEDRYMPPGVLYGLQMKNWKTYQMDAPSWLDDDGAVLARVVGQAVWSATMAWYVDLGCDLPRGQFQMSGITEH